MLFLRMLLVQRGFPKKSQMFILNVPEQGTHVPEANSDTKVNKGRTISFGVGAIGFFVKKRLFSKK